MNPNPTLKELVGDYVARTETTYRDFADRCGLSKSVIGRIMTGTRRNYTQTTLEALAKGMGLPLATVQRAAARTVGVLPNYEPPAERLTLLIDAAGDLSDGELNIVLDLVYSLKQNRYA